MHSWRAHRRGLGWIGIALILLNLCAPALTHAVQLGRLSGVAAHSPDWCGALAPQPAAAIGSDAGDDAPHSAATQAPACGFCTQPALGWAPLPTPLGRGEPPAPVGEVRAIVDVGQPGGPTFPSARPRAPPARTAQTSQAA